MGRQPGRTRASPVNSFGRILSFLLLVVAGFLLCVRPAISLYTPSLRHDRYLVPRADIWAGEEQRIERGHVLHCAMVGNQQDAIQLLGADKAVGKWTEYGDLERYGWQEGSQTDTEGSLAQDALEEGHIFEDLSIDAAQNKGIRIDHTKPVTVDGKPYSPSRATYQSLFNVDAGLLVADYNSSPKAENPSWPDDKFVPLKQWSDVIFLLWEHIAGSNARDLRHHIQCAVANEVTAGIMRKAIGVDDTFSEWDSLSPLHEGGRTFRPGSDAYYALLNTPNGFGIAWFLIQHKAQLGIKTVSEITVFGADGERSLYFKIDPVE